MKFIVFLLLMLVPLLSPAAEFEIFQAGYQPLKLAWLSDGDGVSATDLKTIHEIVVNDLQSSKSFVLLNPYSYLDDINQVRQHVDYSDWRIIGTDILAFAHLSRTGKDWAVDIQVHDPFRNKLLSETTLHYDNPQPRRLAHFIANQIYLAATGIRGCFDTHILYVSKHGNTSDLVYMDQDGANRQLVGRNFTLLLSPDLSPDNNLVALNTYVGSHSRLETFNLQTGQRRTFGNFKGLNSAPAWSPDGRFIAATLSYTGHAQIFLYDTQTGRWSQLTHDRAIDTSPSWSPDGKNIAFTSNQNGSPQIYSIDLSSGKVTRISKEGPYNSAPVWSPRGDRIAFIALKNWQYALATMRADGSDVRYLVTGGQVDTPAWSPNGQMLLFSRRVAGVRRLYRIPSWGGKPQALTSPMEDASDPVWSH